MPKDKADRFAAYVGNRRDRCKFAQAFDSLTLDQKAEVLEAMERHLAPTIARALEGEYKVTVSEYTVRRHMSKRCACFR